MKKCPKCNGEMFLRYGKRKGKTIVRCLGGVRRGANGFHILKLKHGIDELDFNL